MPKRGVQGKYEPLTKEEKEQVLRKHDDFVYRYNTYLQLHGEKELDAAKLRKEVEAKLEDPNEAKKYRICQQIAEKVKRQDEIAKTLNEKYPLPEGANDYLARSLKFLIRTDGSKESEQYNESLYKDYQKDPKAFAYARTKNMLNFDATQITDLQGDEVKMLEWMRDNMAIALEANEFGDPIDPSGALGKAFGPSKRLRENLVSMKGMFQKINYIGSVVKSKYENLDHLAVPEGLGKERAYDMIFKTSKYMEKDYKLSPGMRRSLQEQADFYKEQYSLDDIKNKLIAAGKNPGKDMLIKYYAVKTDPQTGKIEQVPFDQFLQDKPNVTLAERNPGEIERIKYLTKDYEMKYNFEFQKRMGISLDMGAKGYNVFKVISDHKSGLFARDSREYKEFTQALADFTNPEKNGHLDKETLRAKVDAYLEHTERVKPGKNATDPVRRGRIELANTVKKTLNEMDKDGVQYQLANEMVAGASKALEIEKEPAFGDDYSSFFDEDIVQEKEDGLIEIEVNKDKVNIIDDYIEKE